MKTEVDRDALALAVFEQTNVHITSDDPLMAFIVANDIILNAHEKRWQESVNASAKNLQDHAKFIALVQGTTIVASALVIAISIMVAWW